MELRPPAIGPECRQPHLPQDGKRRSRSTNCSTSLVAPEWAFPWPALGRQSSLTLWEMMRDKSSKPSAAGISMSCSECGKPSTVAKRGGSFFHGSDWARTKYWQRTQATGSRSGTQKRRAGRSTSMRSWRRARRFTRKVLSVARIAPSPEPSCGAAAFAGRLLSYQCVIMTLFVLRKVK